MKQYLLGAMMLLLVGAGCNSNTTTEDSASPLFSKSANLSTTAASDALASDLFETDTPIQSGEITLSVEQLGAGEAYFDWSVSADADFDGFILVRAEEANPVHDGKNYWFRQYYTRRAVTWTELPTGIWHVRVCGLLDGTCVAYSNDVVVTVE